MCARALKMKRNKMCLNNLSGGDWIDDKIDDDSDHDGLQIVDNDDDGNDDEEEEGEGEGYRSQSVSSNLVRLLRVA